MGEKWDQGKRIFTENAVYKKFEKDFPFKTTDLGNGKQYTTGKVTLHLVMRLEGEDIEDVKFEKFSKP